jgi:2-phospho-L-lactate/phosphoenolpyruvate guanylyltransferase
MMTPGPLWAVVPVKRFVEAKTRLADILSDGGRSALARAMLRDVLTAVAGCPAIAGIVVVTGDDMAAAIAAPFGALVVEDGSIGYNAAVRTGISHIRERTAHVMVLPADIPLVRAGDIARLASIHPAGPAVTVARAAADGGTNALVMSPPDVIAVQFGTNSEARHVAAAHKAGAAVQSLVIPRMAYDIDRPEDVARFLDGPSETNTYRLLRRMALAGTLSPAGPHLQPVLGEIS